jgi:endoglucanase
MMRRIIFLAVVLSVFVPSAFLPIDTKSPKAADGPEQLIGINIAGGEFMEEKLPGTYGRDYLYPGLATIDYFARKGMTVIRVPMRWERLQHTLTADLDESEMQRLDIVVANSKAKGMHILLDVHNYATYYGSIIGEQSLPISALGDLWGKIARRYKDKDWVIFGLMNEPKDLPTETWLEAANVTIAQIRQTGAKNMIFVPGNGWTSARSWLSGHYGTPNSEVMLKVSDSADNYAFEVHQYFNAGFTGTTADCQSGEIAIETLTPFTQWARTHHKRGFLGEFGAGSDSVCLAALDRALRFMTQNSDVWLGWAYWAAGTLWRADYFTSVQPIKGKDRPQITVLDKYTNHLQEAR